MDKVGIKKKQNSIVEQLKDEILSGNITGGTEMTQNELAEALGVSRMPVREALLILEYQGLVERLPNNHVRVASFSKDYYQEIFFLCEEIEKQALKHGTVEEVATVQGSRFQDPIPKEIELHKAICSQVTNSFLKKTLETIIDIYVDYVVRMKAHNQKKNEKLLEQIIEKAKAKENGWEKELTSYFTQLSSEAEKRG